MPATKTTAKRQITCQSCRKRFRTTNARKKFCSVACQQNAHNTRRRVDLTERALKSKFFLYLALECKRAGTYQILSNHTLESMIELYKVYLLRHSVTGWSTNDNFSVCHIVPVKDKFFLGLLHPQNVVVAPSDMNRNHGTKYFGHGLGLPRNMIKSKHSINEFESLRAVREGVIKFLGRDLVVALVKECKIKPSKFNQDKAWIEARIDSSNPAHVDIALRLYKVKSGKDMGELRREFKALLEGDEYVAGSGFSLKTERFGSTVVLLQEFVRMAQYREDFARYADDFSNALATKQWHRDDAEQVETLFNVLHGRSVESLDDSLYAIRKVYDNSVTFATVQDVQVTTRVVRGYVRISLQHALAAPAVDFDALPF
nr:hypothetical protein [uncultured Pseudomonas sp.]